MAQYNDDYVHDRINRLESIIDNELKPRIQTLETNLKYTFENTTKLVQQHEQVIKNQSALLTLVREILENQREEFEAILSIPFTSFTAL